MTARAMIRRVARPALEAAAVVLAPILRRLAIYGFGSEHLLRWGVLPLPVHYYSPVPDMADLIARDVWSRRSDLPGINLKVDGQIALLQHLASRF